MDDALMWHLFLFPFKDHYSFAREICGEHKLFVRKIGYFFKKYNVFISEFVRGSDLLLLLNTLVNQSQERTGEGAVRLGACQSRPHHSALQGRQVESLSFNSITAHWLCKIHLHIPEIRLCSWFLRHFLSLTEQQEQKELHSAETQRSCRTRARRHVIVS